MTVSKSFEKVDNGYLYYIIDNQLVESYGEVWHRDEWYFDLNIGSLKRIFLSFFRIQEEQF